MSAHEGLTSHLRLSRYLFRWAQSPEQKMQRFLEEITKVSLRKKLSNKFSYVEKLYQQIHANTHSSTELFGGLNKRLSVLIAQLEKLKNPKLQKSLRNQIQHIRNLIQIITKGKGPPRSRREWPSVGHSMLTITQKVEDFAIPSALSYVVLWGLSEWLTVETIEMSGEEISIEQWNTPMIEESDSKSLPFDQLLIDCNNNKIAEDICLDLLMKNASSPSQ